MARLDNNGLDSNDKSPRTSSHALGVSSIAITSFPFHVSWIMTLRLRGFSHI